MIERLQKILASAGIASRRMAETMIAEGRVTVNGQIVTEMGMKADPEVDHIKVDGKLIHKREMPIYCLLHKPKGVLSAAHDAEGKPVVTDLMAHAIPERIFPVGRLDMNTEGALLLTNDGELAHQLSHPASKCPKIYLAKISGQPKMVDLKRLERGITVDGTRYGPCQIELLASDNNSWVKVTLTEGKNHQIKNIFEAIGHPVSKLRRIAFAFLTVEDLEPGQFRLLDPDEVGRLKAGDYRLSHQFKFANTLKKLGITTGPTRRLKREHKPYIKDINAPKTRPRRDLDSDEFNSKPRLRSRDSYRKEESASQQEETGHPRFEFRAKPNNRNSGPNERDAGRPPRRKMGEDRETKTWSPREKRSFHGSDARPKRPRNEEGEPREWKPRTERSSEGPDARPRRPRKEDGQPKEWKPRDHRPSDRSDSRPRRSRNEDGQPREWKARDERSSNRSGSKPKRAFDEDSPRSRAGKPHPAREEKGQASGPSRFKKERISSYKGKESRPAAFKKKPPKGRGK